MTDTERRQIALNLPAATRQQMEHIKFAARISFTDQLIRAIDRLHADLFPDPAAAAVVVGYMRIDRLGEIDAPTCAECGQDIDLARGAFLAALKADADVTLAGPLCAACASSE